MFFGHVAVGLAAKPMAPKAPLGALLVSATALDTLWGVFAIAGIESMSGSEISSIQWSHGLFMAAVWIIAGSALAFLFSRDRRVSVLIGFLVFSVTGFVPGMRDADQILRVDWSILDAGYLLYLLAFVAEFG